MIEVPNGLDGIIATFGDCHRPGFEADSIVSFPVPYALVYGTAMVFHTRCHRALVPVFTSVLDAIKEAGLADRAAHYGGIYAQRSIRAFPKFPSTHSWGIAIDLNPAENPLGGPSRQDPAVVAIFKKFGFVRGGEFKSRLDAMHFQYATGY